MYAVKKAADIVGIAPSTIRLWGKTLAAVLSDSANPPRGEERLYTDEDIIALHTAKVLREEKRSWDDVIASIMAGDVIMPASPQEGERAEAGSQSGLIAASDWDRYTAPFKDHIESLKGQLSKVEDRVEAEMTLRIQVEERIKVEEAARVEVEEELERLRNRSLWQRIRNK